jgi:hypothetical protein
MHEAIDLECIDRRCADRRQRRCNFVLHERRSGFDRRIHGSGRTKVAVLENALIGLRDRPRAVWVILAVVNTLNLADFLLTLNVLSRGGGEANPIMRSLFNMGTPWAGTFKMLAVFTATFLIWRCRRFRCALITSLILASVFSAVLFYHLYGIAALG